MKLKVFTAFSGYDSQCLALIRLKKQYPNFDFELVGWSEIDKFAIQAHNVLFPEYSDRNFGDISKINWSEVPDFDLFTYSSPCQDFSSAGLQRGGEQGSGTRSSLLWECQRAIEEKKPRFCLLENVSALVTEKFIKLFNRWQLTLEKIGYKNFATVLNAADYGVPQNRERVFLVSFLEGKSFNYYFPTPQKLKKSLSDILESEVSEDYFLTEEQINAFQNSTYNQYRNLLQKKPIADTLCSTDYKHPKLVCVGMLNDSIYKKKFKCCRKVYAPVGLAPTQTTGMGGGITTKILTDKKRIRKITPRESFRLMDVDDVYFDKLLNAGLSNTQLYKLAGNSIVVNVLTEIFRKMFIQTKANINEQMNLF